VTLTALLDLSIPCPRFGFGSLWCNPDAPLVVAAVVRVPSHAGQAAAKSEILFVLRNRKRGVVCATAIRILNRLLLAQQRTALPAGFDRLVAISMTVLHG
jgi:hypothetical protein